MLGLSQFGYLECIQYALQAGCKLEGALRPQLHTEGRTSFVINLPPAKVEFWSTPVEAAQKSRTDLSVLCMPHAKNEAAIDAISSPALYWQVNSLPATSSLY